MYVENGSFGEALNIIERLNFCLIVGVPGIGKTMLAQMLLLHYYSLGYDIVKIEGDISEARDVDYEKRRRIFYYDDFLGQASISEKLNKNEDQKLLDFIAAIKRSGVSKFILTTREYILNQAKLIYEKIDRTTFDSETCIVDLVKYTRLNRAQILFNHIYFSDLPAKFKAAFLVSKAYLKIIDHSNYNPRIIEHMTDRQRLIGVKDADYVSRFIASLDNPEELWRHPFASQLSQTARDVLIVLLSLPSEVFLEDLQKAFCSYRNVLAPESDVELTRIFRRAMKEIEGSFVTTSLSREKVIIEFHNPSVRDFLQNYLTSSPEQLRILVRAAVSFDQLRWLWEYRDSRSGHPLFRPSIKTAAKVEFIGTLRLVFVLVASGLHNYRSPTGEFYKTWNDVSFERRASLVVSVVTDMPDESILAIWDQTLKFLDQRIKQRTCDKDDLISLLHDVQAAQLLSPERWDGLLGDVKHFLCGKFDWLSDYSTLLQFMSEFPGVFSDKEKFELADGFPAFARQHVLSDLVIDDPDDFRTCAEEVREIGKGLGLDVSVLVSDIESQASEEERYVKPDKVEDSYTPKPVLELCSNREIESLFDDLDLAPRGV